MLKDEFDRLLTLFNEAAEGKTVNLEEVFKECLVFFEHIKEQITTGSAEDKQVALKMMGELYHQMIIVSKQISERSGMSEEQLMAYAENPANFSPAQWNSIQASREKIAKVGQDLAKTVENSHTGRGEPKKRSSEIKGKKSKWMRS